MWREIEEIYTRREGRNQEGEEEGELIYKKIESEKNIARKE